MTENTTYRTIDDAVHQDVNHQDPATAVPERRPARLFRRSRTDSMLGGVCGGLAATTGIDVTLLRVGLVALTVLGVGAGAVIYAVCWLVVPLDGETKGIIG